MTTTQASDVDALDVPEIKRDGRLDGRVAIITGGGSHGALSGTGSAISVLFAAKGARVAILDLDGERANHTLEAVERVGGGRHGAHRGHHRCRRV